MVRVEAMGEDGTLKVRFLDKMNEELFVQPRVASELGIHICKLGIKIGNISRNDIVSKLYRIIYPCKNACEDENEDVEEEEDDESTVCRRSVAPLFIYYVNIDLIKLIKLCPDVLIVNFKEAVCEICRGLKKTMRRSVRLRH